LTFEFETVSLLRSTDRFAAGCGIDSAVFAVCILRPAADDATLYRSR